MTLCGMTYYLFPFSCFLFFVSVSVFLISFGGVSFGTGKSEGTRMALHIYCASSVRMGNRTETLGT